MKRVLTEAERNEINRSEAVDGVYTWICEVCGEEEIELKSANYDRTKDHSNWPVWCIACAQDYQWLNRPT